MLITDLSKISGRKFPARRLTKNIAGGVSPIQTEHFSLGFVELEPEGGQVPWHNHPEEEVYFILEGTGEMCIGNELKKIVGGQAVFIPPNEYHQLTNIGKDPLKMIYCYGPAGDVDHWKQELEGSLPLAGRDVPELPDGASPQCAISTGQLSD